MAYVGEVVSLQCALDPYDVGVTILYAEGAINERLASFDWELVDVKGLWSGCVVECHLTTRAKSRSPISWSRRKVSPSIKS